MKRIIITADDYGLSKSVNEAIEACLAADIVHSTCVMMNMPEYAEMVSLKDRFPHVSVGIHWTLTQGTPVLPAGQIPSLVDDGGEFHTKNQFQRRWLSGKIKEGELKAELRAQFQRYCNMAGVPDFWCTHQDVHIIPGLYRTCVDLGLGLGIPAMRSHRRIVVSRKNNPTGYFIRHPVFWMKSKIVAQWCGWAEKLGMLMPDGQVQIRGYEMSFMGMEQVLNRLQWNSIRRVVELTIHPATMIDQNVFKASRIPRVHEYKIFSDPLLKEFMLNNGIRTVSYDSLI